jgi:hypothetical protein
MRRESLSRARWAPASTRASGGRAPGAAAGAGVGAAFAGWRAGTTVIGALSMTRQPLSRASSGVSASV